MANMVTDTQMRGMHCFADDISPFHSELLLCLSVQFVMPFLDEALATLQVIINGRGDVACAIFWAFSFVLGFGHLFRKSVGSLDVA